MKLRLPDLVDIKRKTVTDLGNGSFTQDWAELDIDVKASVQPVSLQDVMRAGRKINSLSYKCYMDGTTDVLGDDRITYNGADYNIYAEQSWLSGDAYIKLFLEKII